METLASDWKIKARNIAVFKNGKKEDSENSNPVRLAPDQGRVWSKILPEDGHTRGSVTWNRQHKFITEKICLIILTAIHDKTTVICLYSALVRACLEYYVWLWLPHSWKTLTYWNEVSGVPPRRLETYVRNIRYTDRLQKQDLFNHKTED